MAKGSVAPCEESEDGPLKARNSHILLREEEHQCLFKAL
jgi:hypothetical protein